MPRLNTSNLEVNDPRGTHVRGTLDLLWTFLRRIRAGIMLNKQKSRPVYGYNNKNDTMILLWMQGNQHQSDWTLCCNHKCKGSFSVLEHLVNARGEKAVILITGDWNAKVGSKIPSAIKGKFGLDKQNQAGNGVLPRTFNVYSKCFLPTTVLPDGQYQNQMDCIFCKQRWNSAI